MNTELPSPMQLETDYLIIGAGTAGLSFADELIHSTSDTTLILVDRHARPGGHWNDAYEFVTLQMPALYYGVNSKQLGDGGNDLSSRWQIMVYFEAVMKQLLATNRVKYFPQCEYIVPSKYDDSSNESVHSLMEENCSYTVKVRKKTVDATLLKESVPSVTKPQFGISNGVNFIPINGLFHNKSPWKQYVIIGGGKTSIDAILFLLNQSVNPNRITWIVPNDRWLVNRSYSYVDNYIELNRKILNCVMKCDNYEELFDEWEKVGFMIRLDTNIKVTHFEGAVASLEEVEKLQLIKNVVRNGRVAHIGCTSIIFEDGSEIEVDEETLHINCAGHASSIAPQKIFNGKQIFLQRLSLRGNGYSAAAAAAFEALYPDDEGKKNALLKPVHIWKTSPEFIVSLRESMISEATIAKTLGIGWSRRSRLNLTSHISLLSLLQGSLYFLWYGNKIMRQLSRIISNIETTLWER